MIKENLRKSVRERYGKIARQGTSCCGPAASCCAPAGTADRIGRAAGYTEADLKSVPDGANLGLGCGNPVALASLREGETVLDLGSGAGFDCFLAAKRVGGGGRVIGVDMTPEMLERARANAREGGYGNVEFRLGEIENLPVADGSVDVVISNCVINLSPDKERVFREAFRVLKPGGRLMVADMVLLRELPDAIKKSMEAYTACIAGAETRERYLSLISGAGFDDVTVVGEARYPIEGVLENPDLRDVVEGTGIDLGEIGHLPVASIKVRGTKPGK